MSDLNLHEGIWTRRVLKGKKKVGVAFIPNKPTVPHQSTQIKIDDDNKTAWENLLGGNPDFDIDLGLMIIRFNPDGTSGTAVFLPHLPSQAEITHTFQQSEPDPTGPVEGSEEFFSCIESKRTALGSSFNLPLAFAECLPLFLV